MSPDKAAPRRRPSFLYVEFQQRIKRIHALFLSIHPVSVIWSLLVQSLPLSLENRISLF